MHSWTMVVIWRIAGRVSGSGQLLSDYQAIHITSIITLDSMHNGDVLHHFREP